MAYADKSLIPISFSAFDLGIDDASRPQDLPPNQGAFAVNFTTRGSTPNIRPPFRRLNILFPDQATKNFFEDNIFQGGAPYVFNSGIEYFYELICSVGGRIFAISLTNDYVPFPGFPFIPGAPLGETINGTLRDITPASPNSSLLNRAWFQQAAQYMIIQDNVSRAIIYQHGKPTFRASNSPSNPQVPVGGIMAYGQGRLIVTVDGNKIIAGDLYGSKYPDPAFPGKVAGDEVIEFTENEVINEGGFFTVPTEFNQVQGMLFTQVGDTNAGQGMLVVGTESAYSSFDTSLDRATWKNSNFGRINASGCGVFGDRSMTNINSDIFNRSPDGVRDLIQARRDSQTKWQNTPQSYEVSPILDQDSKTLLSYCSAVFFDRRMLMTVGPYFQGVTVAHQALVSMNFDGVSSLTRQTSPCWEGFWTGLRITLIMKQFQGSHERCFAFTRGQDNKNQLYEILAQGDFDQDCQAIPAFIDTRAYDLTTPNFTNQLQNGFVWLNNLKGDIEFCAQYRPNYYPGWFNWDCFNYTFNYKTCTGQNCTLPNYKPGYVPGQALAEPPEQYVEPDPNFTAPIGFPESTLSTKGQLMQFRFFLTGNSGAAISLVTPVFRPKPDTAVGNVANK